MDALILTIEMGVFFTGFCSEIAVKEFVIVRTLVYNYK